MQTSDFVMLLQNELILQRDPHIVDRFQALLDEHFEERPPQEPESATADPVGSEPDPASTSETSASTAEAGSSNQYATDSDEKAIENLATLTRTLAPERFQALLDEHYVSTGSSDQQPTESAAS